MRILSALIGAGLVLSVATAGIAQTTSPTANANTKVYAYQKRTHQAKDGNTATATTARPTENIPNAAPHGTPRWWEVMDRSNAGGAE